MVELIPSPDGLRDVIGIVAADVFHVAEVNDDVAGHGCSGDDLLHASDDDEMTVREYDKIMMRANHGDVAFGAGGRREGGVELRGRHLPNEVVRRGPPLG